MTKVSRGVRACSWCDARWHLSTQRFLALAIQTAASISDRSRVTAKSFKQREPRSCSCRDPTCGCRCGRCSSSVTDCRTSFVGSSGVVLQQMPLRLDKQQICSTSGIPSKGLKDGRANSQREIHRKERLAKCELLWHMAWSTRVMHVLPGRSVSKRAYLEKSPKRAAEAPQRSRLNGVFSSCWLVKTYRIRAGQQL